MKNKKILTSVFILVGFLIIFSLFAEKKIKRSGDIRIPLSEISEQAKWYEYSIDGVKMRFFVVKAEDGSIKTAFDTCDICYKKKRGYRQEDKYMVCNNCENRYLINNLGTENENNKGCWPGYLPNRVEDDKIIIKKKELEKGKWRFT
ncbi:MAG: DUF2318 domain-containing protein [Candidatus Pacearchaeota archaeon]